MSREVYTCLTKSSIIYVQRSPVYICLAESSLIKSLTGAHSCRLPHCALHSCCPSHATQSQPSEIHRHKQNREKIRTILPNPSPFSPGLTGVCLLIKVDVVRERDNQHKHLNKNPLQLPSYVIKLSQIDLRPSLSKVVNESTSNISNIGQQSNSLKKYLENLRKVQWGSLSSLYPVVSPSHI